jgi:hypothetical protein
MTGTLAGVGDLAAVRPAWMSGVVDERAAVLKCPRQRGFATVCIRCD